MAKRSSLEIKKEIIKVLNDGKEHSYGELERRVNTNWQTIRDQCKELEYFNKITIINNKVNLKR